MSDTKWAIHGREFANCNCSYGCPCQFNALPTYGNCSAVVASRSTRGNHGDTSLDGLRLAGIFRYPEAHPRRQWRGAAHRRQARQ